MNLRRYAEGKPCMVRLPGICSGDPMTVVLAHFRGLPGLGGMGQKPPDVLGAWACHDCHNEIDRRTRHMDYDAVREAFMEGVIRTQARLVRDGVLRW